MDKTVLEQYVELKEEIKDLHNRIDRDRRRLVKIENEGVVSYSCFNYSGSYYRSAF